MTEEVANLLKNENVNINETDDKGLTGLHLACLNGNFGIVILLVVNNANLELKAIGILTPLSVACWKGHFEIAKYLITKGNYDKKDLEEDLAYADKNHTEIIEFLKSQM